MVQYEGHCWTTRHDHWRKEQVITKLHILAVDNQGNAMCFINTMEMFESGIPIVSYYVMDGDNKLTDRVELWWNGMIHGGGQSVKDLIHYMI